jgi:hypothetical protein
MHVRTIDNGADIINKMYLTISRAQFPCHILYSGHLGSGKSTELNRLKAKLEENRLFVCFVDVQGKLDLDTLKHTDLFIFLLESLLGCAKEHRLSIKEEKLNQIKNYLLKEETKIVSKTGSAEAEFDASFEAKSPSILFSVLSLVSKIRASMQIKSDYRDEWRINMEPDINTYIRMINSLLRDIRDSAAEKSYVNSFPIILIDSLEKTANSPVIQLFSAHSSDLVRLDASMVISYPVSLTYLPMCNHIKSYFTLSCRLPMIELWRWNQNERKYINKGALIQSPGFRVLREIILRRIDESIIDDEALMMIIQKTGGFLRDLFSAAFSSALNALAKGHDKIEVDDAFEALDEMRSEICSQFPDKSKPILIKIISGDKMYAYNEQLAELMQSGAVLEYNGKRWVDVHPLVEEWLKDNGMMKAYELEQ